LYDKLPVYYAAMRYSHWNMCMLPCDRVVAEGVPDHIEVIVAGGLTHVECKLPAALLQEILMHAGGGTLSPGWPLVEISETGGHLAPNVLVSRRSYREHHAIPNPSDPQCGVKMVSVATCNSLQYALVIYWPRTCTPG